MNLGNWLPRVKSQVVSSRRSAAARCLTSTPPLCWGGGNDTPRPGSNLRAGEAGPFLCRVRRTGLDGSGRIWPRWTRCRSPGSVPDEPTT